MKYSGEMYDVFDLKMNLFRDNCSKVGIEEHQLAPAFSIMLRGKASIFYANRLCGRGIRDFDTMVDNVRRYFETEEKRQSYLSEWRETTFNRIMQKHPDKSKTQVLDDLIEKLALIQRALPVSYHSDEVLRTQLLNACSGIKELSTAMRIQHNQYIIQQPDPIDQYWVDRTYRGQGRNSRFGNNHRDRAIRESDPNSGGRGNKKCFVCKRTGCWSTKHLMEDRRKAYERYKSNRDVRDTSSTAKEKTFLAATEQLIFNGGIVSLTSATDTSITLIQKGQGTKLQLIDTTSPTAQQDYVQQRARGAYIASICQPEACFDLSTAAQHKEPNDENIKALNRRLKWQMDSLDRGLHFIPLDLATAKLFVFVDGSFANNSDLTSQLGFVIVLANEDLDDDNSTFTIHGIIIHFSST
ncbi:hypothetical protein CMUS01_14421, partial [Colletotrichum musicola]